MIADAIPALQAAVADHLKSGGATVEFDGVISGTTPWRPLILETDAKIAWQLHSVSPDTLTWENRIERARVLNPKLRIGIAAPEEVFRDAEFLTACYRLQARLLLLKSKKNGFVVECAVASVPDLICERRIRLDSDTARATLDLALEHALAAKTKAEKGVTLELLVALLLSQVDNFEVANIGIANRTQQMDVLVHNRSVGGILSNSSIVLAEAKNWRNKKVTPTEHAHFLRKLATRNQRAKLGFLVTTGSFTSGLALEARRDSTSEVIVVFVDGKELPKIWRGPASITQQIERLVIEASVGT